MCRNIKTLANFEPPATDEEIQASALQFVRKLSGTNRPSRTNEAAFNRAVSEVTDAARRLIHGVAERGPLRTRDIDVHIDHLDADGVNARLECTAEYPEAALSVALERFRQHVGEEVMRLLGRPLRRLDVVVSDLVVDIEPGLRVQ